MDKFSKIRELMRSIAGTDRPSFSFRLMEVVAVEGDVCRARIDDFEIPDIRLSSIEGGAENGLLIVPAAGSIVLVADLSCGHLRELCVVGYSEIESVRFHQGDTTLTLDGSSAEVVVGSRRLRISDGRVVFNDGDRGGLINIDDLVDRINTIEQSINELKRIFSGWEAQAQDGGKTLQLASEKWAAAPLRETTKADIEDTNVIH